MNGEFWRFGESWRRQWSAQNRSVTLRLATTCHAMNLHLQSPGWHDVVQRAADGDVVLLDSMIDQYSSSGGHGWRS